MSRQILAAVFFLLISACFVRAEADETEPVKIVKAQLKEQTDEAKGKVIVSWKLDLKNSTLELRRPTVVISFKNDEKQEVVVGVVSVSPLYPKELKTFTGSFDIPVETREKVKSARPEINSSVVAEAEPFIVEPMNLEEIAGDEYEALIKWTVALKSKAPTDEKTLIQAIFVDEDNRNVECTGGSSIVKVIESGWEGFLTGQLKVERDCWQKVHAMTNTAYVLPSAPREKTHSEGMAVSGASPLMP